MKISLLTPTRFRPDFVTNLVKSAYDNISDKKQLEFVFYIDHDDRVSLKNLLKLKETYPVIYTSGERIVLSQMWNRCYDICSGEIIMHCGDDIVFKTKDWDNLVRQAFQKYPDRILLVYGNDMIHGWNLATHSFLHRNWVEAVGYFLPPYFVSDYNDTWLTDVARKINRIEYIPELHTEHMHFSVGKATIDSNTQDRLNRAAKDDPGLIYQRKEGERIENANKLLKFIEEYKSGDYWDSINYNNKVGISGYKKL